MDPLAVGFALWLLFHKKDSPSASGASHVSTPMELLHRANQPRASAWVPYFVDVGELPVVAAALSRWAGIESSGDATIVSSLGERGLLQVGKQTQSEGGIDARDWAALVNHDTLPTEHARIMSHYWRWLFSRAARHLHGSPNDQPLADPINQVWFAYLYHQRPKDFTQYGQLPNYATAAASHLLSNAENNPQLTKRVHAANVVAFGVADVPMVTS